MKQISHDLRAAVDALADLSARTEDGYQYFRMLRRILGTKTFEPAQGNAPTEVSSKYPAARIGIWELQSKGDRDQYVRSPQLREPASLWANINSIELRGRSKRVVVIGESVARGFFFDPHFNPSMALQHMLRAASGDEEVEVIDLARTDLLLNSLTSLAAAAVSLKPDAVVVLAGNNWHPMHQMTALDQHRMADVLRQGSWADVKQYLEGLLRDQVRTAINILCELARLHRFSLIVALPEFNLVDWRTDALSPPMLNPTETARWNELRVSANAAIARQSWKEAEEIGAAISCLDRGTTPVGSNAIAVARLRAGRQADARNYFQAACDAAICWPRGPETPRCYSPIQEVIRAEAAKGRFVLVDLPRVFEDYGPGGLPDRRLFLDYCHMTIAGTRLAMSAIAQAALAAMFKIRRRINEINSAALQVDTTIEGEAHFLAAIHNANWGQDEGVVGYHCAKAVQLSPGIHTLMTLFMDFHIRRTPAALCKSFDQICQLQHLSLVSLLFDSANPTAESFLNMRLINQIISATRSLAPKDQLYGLLFHEHSVNDQEVNLLNRTYSTESYHASSHEADFAFYRAQSPVSCFRLVCERPTSLKLDVTYRSSIALGDSTIGVSISGRLVCILRSAGSWTTASVIVPAESLCSGVNTLEITWPEPQWDYALQKATVLAQIEGILPPDVCPVYGEIHRLRASAVSSQYN